MGEASHLCIWRRRGSRLSRDTRSAPPRAGSCGNRVVQAFCCLATIRTRISSCHLSPRTHTRTRRCHLSPLTHTRTRRCHLSPRTHTRTRRCHLSPRTHTRNRSCHLSPLTSCLKLQPVSHLAFHPARSFNDASDAVCGLLGLQRDDTQRRGHLCLNPL